MSFLLTADIGGTKTILAIFNKEGLLLGKTRFATPTADTPSSFLNYFYTKALQLYSTLKLTPGDIAGLGVCVAGFLNYETGVMVHSPNIMKWDGFPLKKELKKRFNLTPVIENDANAAAWGEYVYSLRKVPHNMLYVTVSTGIGSGIILDKKIYRGENGFAGELGHLKVQKNGPICPCGGYGCLERVAAGEAITRIAKNIIRKTKNRSFLKKCREITTKTVFEAAKNQDFVAFYVLNKALFSLARGLSHFINLFNPGCLVLGGGVMKEYDFIYPYLKKHLASMVITPAYQNLT
ncbi:MAG: ROK family protein, partial [Firmicutes bacterium]|nr:ROK family protein [Bacillota bacterium]